MPSTDLPNRMTAIAISAPGGPEVLRPVTVEVPRPASGDVLIRIAAAGVNRPDCLQRRGMYPPPAGASELPGLEVAGTVVEAGATVTNVAVGDPVCALLAGGGYAEYCTAPAVQCLPIPAGMDSIEAAAVPETFFTVWTNLVDRGRLKSGERLLVHGGASGIGTTAIQIGRALKAQVFATAGSDEKTAACERLGAERAVNYRSEDFVEVISSLTSGDGVDVILDIVGADYFVSNVKLLKTDGRLVIIGLLSGSMVEMNLVPLMTKRLTVTGSTLRNRSPAEKGVIAQSLAQHVWPWLESGEVRPVIQQTYPLEEAASAHAVMENNQTIGKLVLVVNHDR